MNETTVRRQQAIDVLLRLMGCTDARTSNCEHVAAVAELADVSYLTFFEVLDEYTDGLLTKFGLKPVTITAIRDDVSGHREGKLR